MNESYLYRNFLKIIHVSTLVVTTHETGNALDRGESGRCRVHCINGNCVDGKCQCRNGYQGEFCNERESLKLIVSPNSLQ